VSCAPEERPPVLLSPLGCRRFKMAAVIAIGLACIAMLILVILRIGDVI